MRGRGAVPIFSLPHSPAKDLSPQLGLSWGKGGWGLEAGLGPGFQLPSQRLGWGSRARTTQSRGALGGQQTTQRIPHPLRPPRRIHATKLPLSRNDKPPGTHSGAAPPPTPMPHSEGFAHTRDPSRPLFGLLQEHKQGCSFTWSPPLPQRRTLQERVWSLRGGEAEEKEACPFAGRGLTWLQDSGQRHCGAGAGPWESLLVSEMEMAGLSWEIRGTGRRSDHKTPVLWPTANSPAPPRA